MIRSNDPGQAFIAYERAMRPMVEKAQGIPRIVPRLANPHSRWGIRILHGVLGLASAGPVMAAVGKLFGGGDAKEPDLSRYRPPASVREVNR
ncbi:hypothetical protein P0F65_05710 [Sphingomonas sp. I4]